MIAEREYKDVKIRVVRGDITKLEVEAIVNPANSMLVMGGGVAGAIKRAGGKEIEDEAVKRAPVPVGKAIATTAGKLKAKYVIHAPTMKRPAMRIGPENARKAMRGALECARELNVKSIAFPGLGTGVGGVSAQEAAEVMVDELKKHIDEGTSLEEVLLVGFGEELANAFKEVVENALS